MSGNGNERFDAVVIGGGHNGLTAATTLARGGKSVLLVERREQCGGLSAGEEFVPGYRTTGVLHDAGGVSREVVRRLGLEKHGLELRPAPPVLLAEGDRPGLMLTHDPAAARDEIARYSTADADAYERFRAFTGRLAPIIRRLQSEPPPELASNSPSELWRLGRTALAVRLLGRSAMMELLRAAPMCVADWLAEWFETELLRAGLAAPALHASFAGPWSPSTNLNLLLDAAREPIDVVGGPAALVRALESAATAAGVEIRAGSQVEKIDIDRGAARGVLLRSGDGTTRTVAAPRVLASCDPKHLLLDLVERGRLDGEVEHDIVHYRTRGTSAKIHLALSRYPRLAGRPDVTPEHIRLGGTIDGLELAFDAVKYRRMSKRPILDVRVPTVASPELAPAGHHVASILVHFAPWDLEGGWSEAARGELYRRTLRVLTEAAPGIADDIVGHEIITPAELESVYGTTHGHLLHGEPATDQLLARPSRFCPGHSTPIEGLYLCGSGSHPGGGVTCLPGSLGAQRAQD